MKNLRLFLTILGGLGMTIGLILVLFLFSLNFPGSPALAGGAVRYVATTGSDAGNDCLDSGNPCGTVQHAVNISENNDYISIADGTYTENLVITKSVTLSGENPNSTVIDGNNIGQVISNSANLNIINLQIVHGHIWGNGSGAGIGNSGTMVISNTIIVSNTQNSLNYWGQAGGGIYNAGTMSLTNTTVSNNFSTDEGGGIYNAGNLYMDEVQVLSNTAKIGGGIANFNNAKMVNSSITQNRSTISASSQPGGGGIYNELGNNFLIINTSITSNSSFQAGTGINNAGYMVIQDSNISFNLGKGIYTPGTIYNSGNLEITHSSIYSNTTGNGGGIANSGVAMITSTLIAKNHATDNNGGGIYNCCVATGATIKIWNSSIISNVVSETGNQTGGGGISNDPYGSANYRMVEIRNSEISGNYSAYGGGGISNQGQASNIYLENTSIVKNQALYYGGGTDSGFYAINTIIAQNWPTNCEYGNYNVTLGHNLEDNKTCGFSLLSDFQNTDPELADLNTDTEVWFHALLLDSPAIDNGDDSVCSTLDIRNKTRPRDGDFDGVSHCDIGAYEFILPPLQIVAPSLGQINTSINVEARVTVITLTTPITFNWTVSEVDLITHVSQYVDNVSLGWSTTGTKIIQVQATGSNGVQITNTETIASVYMQFLPSVLTPFAPEAGTWDSSPGFFYVTPDRKNIERFWLTFTIPDCGSFYIETDELAPIINHSFSFNEDGYYATGTFDSSTTAHGVYGLDNVYIYYCDIYWTIPMKEWTATWDETYLQNPHIPAISENPLNENLPYEVEFVSPPK